MLIISAVVFLHGWAEASGSIGAGAGKVSPRAAYSPGKALNFDALVCGDCPARRVDGAAAAALRASLEGAHWAGDATVQVAAVCGAAAVHGAECALKLELVHYFLTRRCKLGQASPAPHLTVLGCAVRTAGPWIREQEIRNRCLADCVRPRACPPAPLSSRSCRRRPCSRRARPGSPSPERARSALPTPTRARRRSGGRSTARSRRCPGRWCRPAPAWCRTRRGLQPTTRSTTSWPLTWSPRSGRASSPAPSVPPADSRATRACSTRTSPSRSGCLTSW